MSKKIIPIFYTLDEKYAPLVSVSILSLLKNASDKNKYMVHIIYEDLSDETQEKLKKMATSTGKDVEVEFASMNDELGFLTDRPNTRLNADYFTLTIYFRIFIPEMFPQYDKGIYIDSDTVLAGDVADLFDMELGNEYLVGACPDISIWGNESFLKYVEQSDGVERDKYFNSGVLLLNMSEMRKVGFVEHFLYLLKKYDFDVVAPDQDYLNAMCYGRVKLLSNEWDAMPAEGQPLFSSPKLIHYNHFLKPWHYDEVPYGEYFWEYATVSPFLDEIKTERVTFEENNQDMEKFGNLVQHAVDACNNEVTFKTVFESGEELRAGKE